VGCTQGLALVDLFLWSEAKINDVSNIAKSQRRARDQICLPWSRSPNSGSAKVFMKASTTALSKQLGRLM
jgi:hypothetical protein